jgi:F-type H+-transporting ATPase subunit alpha
MSRTPIEIVDTLIADLQKSIDTTDSTAGVVNSGTVVYLGDGIAKVSGLKNVAYNETVTFESGAQGVALNLEEYSVGVVILSGFADIREGMTATATGQILQVPVGTALLGRVVDALGNPIDGM